MKTRATYIILVTILLLATIHSCINKADKEENDLFHRKYESLMQDSRLTFMLDSCKRHESRFYYTHDSSIVVWDNTSNCDYRTMTFLTKHGDVLSLIYVNDSLSSVFLSKASLVVDFCNETGFMPVAKLKTNQPIFRYNLLTHGSDFCFLDPTTIPPQPKGPVFHFSLNKNLDSIQFYRNGLLNDSVILFDSDTTMLWKTP